MITTKNQLHDFFLNNNAAGNMPIFVISCMMGWYAYAGTVREEIDYKIALEWQGSILEPVRDLGYTINFFML